MSGYPTSWWAVALLTLPLILAGCDDVVTVEAPPPDLFASGDAVLGRVAFGNECAQCHASRDGFDLAHFSFDASTIVRRAVAHVDTASALDIVAHVRSLNAGSSTRSSRLFQPGGKLLVGDVEFALELFGVDAWPQDLSVAELLAMNPRNIPVALPFPQWSVEENNLDWMPDVPLNDPILEWNNGKARLKLEEFYRTKSTQDLITAVQAIRVAERTATNPAAPCVMSPIESLRPTECFETRRWAATLGAQYMLRHGLNTPIHSVIHDAWWDVGFVARRTILRDGHFEHGDENWAVWMWLGWSFEPDRHASVYLSQGLDRLGLNRHAVFHTLRAQVARPRNSLSVFQDVRTAARFAPAAWTFAAVDFAMRHARDRLEAGELPTDITRAVKEVRGAYTAAVPNLSAAEQASLLVLRDEVLSRLGS